MGSDSKRGSLGRCFNCFFIGNTVADSRVFSGVTLATDPHSDAGDFNETVRDVHLTVRAAGAHRRYRRPSRNRVEIIEAKTRTTDSPYYQINRSGRVPYLVDDAGVGMEDSQLICAYLDSLDASLP